MPKARGMRARIAKPSGPLEQRDRLQAQRQAAYDTYAAQTQRRQRADRERGAAVSAVAQVESDRAKGQATDAEADEASERLAAAAATYDDALARANSALDTTKALDVQLAELYADEFVVFADEAEKASKRADAALNEMLAAYRRAEEEWAAAQVAWSPLCSAVRIQGMAAFPLTEHEMAPVVRGWTARPPGIEVLDLEEHEDVEEAAILEGLDVAG